MGSVTDFLSYFVMGTEGMKRFAQNGTLNTDDRLYLEFSAPFSIASPAVMSANVDAIGARRESILPYLKPAADTAALQEQRSRWNLQLEAGKIGDVALARFLGGNPSDPGFLRLLRQLNFEYPSYAPGRFLGDEYQATLALEPRLLQQSSFALMTDEGGRTVVEISAVLVPINKTRASIMFVDNSARVVYGQWYVENYGREGLADRLAVDVMTAVRAAYDGEAAAARGRKQALPSAARTLGKLKAVIGSRVQRVQPES
jgi:spermidine synthase